MKGKKEGIEMKKKCILGFFLAMCLSFVSGCSSKSHLKMSEVSEDTVYINQSGKIELLCVESFDKEYYQKDELKTFVEETVDTYKAQTQDKSVELVDFQVEEGNAKVLLTMENAQVYTDFQGEHMQVISSEEMGENIVLPENFIVSEDGSTIEKEKVLQESGLKFVIVEESINVIVEGTIKYYIDAIITGSNQAQTTGENVSIIVFQ